MLSVEEVGKQIFAIYQNMPCQTNMRTAHVVHFAMAGLKYLILYSESDEVKLKAILALLDIPFVKAKMKSTALITEVRDQAELSKQLSELLVGTNPADLRALERAESQILPAKPKKTNENP